LWAMLLSEMYKALTLDLSWAHKKILILFLYRVTIWLRLTFRPNWKSTDIYRSAVLIHTTISITSGFSLQLTIFNDIYVNVCIETLEKMWKEIPFIKINWVHPIYLPHYYCRCWKRCWWLLKSHFQGKLLLMSSTLHLLVMPQTMPTRFKAW
jgi:hypothetical protein